MTFYSKLTSLAIIAILSSSPFAYAMEEENPNSPPTHHLSTEDETIQEEQKGFSLEEVWGKEDAEWFQEFQKRGYFKVLMQLVIKHDPYNTNNDFGTHQQHFNFMNMMAYDMQDFVPAQQNLNNATITEEENEISTTEMRKNMTPERFQEFQDLGLLKIHQQLSTKNPLNASQVTNEEDLERMTAEMREYRQQHNNLMSVAGYLMQTSKPADEGLSDEKETVLDADIQPIPTKQVNL